MELSSFETYLGAAARVPNFCGLIPEAWRLSPRGYIPTGAYACPMLEHGGIWQVFLNLRGKNTDKS